ncbi:coiled-coil domain-containing protein 177 isoform X1 [Poecilia reticulata]|uniref:coiled-coil domain-containing protein 177 isoform X1 n=1 Tax=Poecilia reticulata TaxID=8081 RepID=UPI0004A2405E|nr:PREDICTED: coiled-coil domain-containing protein 177-like isoform X1 [Poecilia reticulata]
MEKLRSSSPALCLDLNHSEPPGAGKSSCVITSPHSLESRTQPGIKPVQLLIRSLNELIAGQQAAPHEAMRTLHESYEKERSKLFPVPVCSKEQERIIQAERSRWPRSNAASSSAVVKKVKNHSAEPVVYADLCFKAKSCSSVSPKRDPERSTISSFSLGDLRYSPSAERKLQKITSEIKRKTCITVPERDRKIAALMLVKHQKEQERLKLCLQEEQERQEARRKEEARQAQAEKERRRRLKQRMKHWHTELEARRRLRLRLEQEKAAQLQQEMLLQENRWRKLKEVVEVQRREKLEAALKQTEERKKYQERLLREKMELEKRELEKEKQAAEVKKEKAWRTRELQEKRERKRLQEENHREMLRHILLKRQEEQKMAEDEEQKRNLLEKKLQRSSEKRARAAEAQHRRLRERAAQQDVQVQRAQLRAKLQRVQELTHKQILVQQSQRRMERAAKNASALRRSRSQQRRDQSRHRQVCHQQLSEKIQREAEASRRLRENYVCVKEGKRERLQKLKEQIQEEARRLVQASFHLRDRVRQQTHNQTFHQMALDAQLTASMSRIKL